MKIVFIIVGVTGQRTGPYLYGNTSSVRDGKEIVTGIFVNCDSPVQCTAICQDNSENDVDVLCNIFGFDGRFCNILLSFILLSDGDTVPYQSSIHGDPPENITIFVGNITCPSEASTFMNCSQESNSVPYLLDCDEVLVLECFSRFIVLIKFIVYFVLSDYLATSSIGSVTSSSSPTTSPTPAGPTDDDDDDSDANVGLIAGVSVAAVVVVVAVVVIVAVVGALVYRNVKRKSAVIPISVKPAKS